MKQFSANTGIRVQYLDTSYVPGKGAVPSWVDLSYEMGESTHLIFPCEWINAFGGDVFQAETLKIKELSTIKMGYNPKLFEVLNSKQVKIWRNDETGDAKAFTVYGPADNVRMGNKMLVFKVNRLDVK